MLLPHPLYEEIYWNEEEQSVYSGKSGEPRPIRIYNGSVTFRVDGKTKSFKATRLAWECYYNRLAADRVKVIDKSLLITKDNLDHVGFNPSISSTERLEGTVYHPISNKWKAVVFDGEYKVIAVKNTAEEAHQAYLEYTGQI